MSSDDIPEPDRIEGAPHPRETLTLIGQAQAEAAFLDALNTHRMHHAWLITGPRGVGKATLAWQLARVLLTEELGDGGMFAPAPVVRHDLTVDPELPVMRRIMAGSESRLLVLRRPYDEKAEKLKQDITVDEVRRVKGFFQMSATDGGRRVVIVDSADDMNPNAANALLKLLEEPPADAVLLLVSHQPSRLLPTIRSRCRELRCGTLTPPQMAQALAAAGADAGPDTAALAELSGGSVGEAIRLTNLEGLTIYDQMIALFAGLPMLDRPRALALAESVVGRAHEPRFDMMLRLMDLFLARVARAGAGLPPAAEASNGERALLQRLAPSHHAGRAWAELQQTLGARARHGKSVNLDPAALILDMVLKIDETATRVAAR